jgi:hypothetical protein
VFETANAIADDVDVDDLFLPIERRSEPRLSPSEELVCKILDRTGRPWQPANILDLSQHGIRISTTLVPRSGYLWLVLLTKKSDGFARTMLIRIRHSSREGTGNYIVGGKFIRDLSSIELEALTLPDLTTAPCE